jgi:hypothetical protein
METLPAGMMDRAIHWAYPHEPYDSFAIERVAERGQSAQIYQLLRQARERIPLSEDYLVHLQNATISDPFDMAAAFRHEPNHFSEWPPRRCGGYLGPARARTLS